MQAKTHEFTGISIALVASAITARADLNAVTYTATMVAGAAIGSLLPDIDHRGSKISREHKVISNLVSGKLQHRGITHSLLANVIVAAVCFACSALFTSFYDNGFAGRIAIAFLMTGVFQVIYSRFDFIRHAVTKFLPAGKYLPSAIVFLFVYLSADVFVQYVNVFSSGIVLGYFSHLLADACTVSGIAPFQPFSNTEVHLAHFKTGEHEGIFRIICGAIACAVVVLWFASGGVI